MADNTPVPVGVPQTSNKAKVAFIVSLLGGIATFVVAYFPDNDNVQVWGGLTVGLLTVIGTSYGVYQQANYALPVRNQDGYGGLVYLLVAGILLLLFIWLLFALFGGRGDNDAKHGNDWERAPHSSIAKHGNDWEKTEAWG